MFAGSGASSVLTRGLALATLWGIALYVLIDAVLNFLPPHYSLISQPESDYAVGPYGLLMSANFVLRGLFSLALVAALHRGMGQQARSRAGLVLLSAWALGAFLLATFPTDVGSGRPSLTGGVHALVAFCVFLCAAVGELLTSLRFSEDERFASLRLPALAISALTLAVYVAFVVAAFEVEVPGAGGALGDFFGLLERAFLGLILAWMVLVALRLRSVAAREYAPRR